MQAPTITFEDRVEAQRQIERVYYAHRVGAKGSFEQAVPRELLERKVRDSLRQSVALERYWNTPITGDALRKEIQRIARNTRFPDRLREIYDALKNDSFFKSQPRWQKALEQLIKMGVRAEQQALAMWGLNYVIDEYLPAKLERADEFLP